MSIVLKDGTVLPDIPNDVLAECPYIVISSITDGTVTAYTATASAARLSYVHDSLTGNGYDCLLSNELTNYYMYITNADDTAWEQQGFASENIAFHLVGNAMGIIHTPLWSNHDIFVATAIDTETGLVTEVGTEIYFPSSVKSNFILPDGTELPPLPEGCFEKYPYGMISYVEITDGEAAYALSVAEGTYIFAPGSETGEGSDYVISLLPGYRHYRYVVSPTAASGWEQYAESTTQHSGHDFSREDGTMEIRWCNHDILTATAMNDDGTPEVGPDLYRKSDVNYRIYGGWLNSMGNQARRLGNVSGALKPGEMESVFSGATLEPLTVTPTTEEQTFTPESPCIGFSVVTVEAAPDTGGGDSGDTETYPDAENVNFGTTSAGSELYTGKYFYGTYSTAINLPDIDTQKYPYLVFTYHNWIPSLIATDKPFYRRDNSTIWAGYGVTCTYNEYIYDTSTGKWTAKTVDYENYNGSVSPITLYWCNYDIVYSSADPTVHKAASEPVPETVAGADTSYIETAETYTISGATLTALGAVTQQITGIAATTPSAMVSALQMYAGTH